jgi:hypothetical protein
MKRNSLLGSSLVLLFGVFSIASAHADTVTYDTSLAAPGFYNGTGNANTNFTVADGDGIELGLSAVTRFTGAINPGAGSNVYTVTPGTSSGDATWDWEFSINTQPGGVGTSTLENFTYTMNVTDLTASNAGPTFDPTQAIPDDSYYGPSGKTSGLATETSTTFGAQNSENLSFAGFLPGFNANSPDLYQITLDAYQGSTLVDSVSIDANATGGPVGSPVPEPGTIMMVATGLLGLGSKLRRRS